MDRKQIQDQLDWLANEYWEWAYLISKVRVYRAIEGIGTMASDMHWRIYWDPALDWDDMEVRTIVVHELGHIFGDDGARAIELEEGHSIILELLGRHRAPEEVDPYIWNIAGDTRINPRIREFEWAKFPTAGDAEARKDAHKKGQTGGVFPETFNLPDGQPPEWYYDVLVKEPERWPSGDGDGEGQGQGSGTGRAANGKCGSVAGGEKKEWEDEADDDCMSEEEKEAVVEETERRVAERVRTGHSPSSGEQAGKEARPPMLLDENKITAKVNFQLWLDTEQQILYENLEHSSRSYDHPHRRIPGLPGKRRVPKQAVIVNDISGSINSLSVQRSFELMNRLYGRGFDIRMIVCDTQAQVVTDRTAVYSGGGTDMGAGLRLAAQQFPHAGVVIVVTDGHTPWPGESPCTCPVVVLSWAMKGPEWARSIAMPGLTEDQLQVPAWT